MTTSTLLSADERGKLLQEARDSTAGWRNEALAEYQSLRREFESLPPHPEEIDYRTAAESLDEALSLIAPTTSLSYWRQPGRTEHPIRQWFWELIRVGVTGTRPDEVWQALHAAEEAMLMLYDEPALRREAPRLADQLARLGPSYPHLGDVSPLIQSLKDTATPTSDDSRARLRDFLEDAHGRSDRYQRTVRSFRNKLYLATVAIGLALLAAAIAHVINHNLFSVCSSDTSVGSPRCPQGTDSPAGYDVFGVCSMGILGGLLSAIVPFVRGQMTSGRYRINMAQIALKVMAGALSGFLGVLFLQSGLLVGLSPVTGYKIWAYAAFFGFAQQALTGLIDRRAGDLAKQGPAQHGPRPALSTQTTT